MLHDDDLIDTSNPSLESKNARNCLDLCNLSIARKGGEDAVNLVILKHDTLLRTFHKHPPDGSIHTCGIEFEGVHEDAHNTATIDAKHGPYIVAAGTRAQRGAPYLWRSGRRCCREGIFELIKIDVNLYTSKDAASSARWALCIQAYCTATIKYILKGKNVYGFLLDHADNIPRLCIIK
jgi:hypothetical protein